jgi:hypothetical protein
MQFNQEKLIVVNQGVNELRNNPPAVWVVSCDECGALVINQQKHEDWHSKIQKTMDFITGSS